MNIYFQIVNVNSLKKSFIKIKYRSFKNKLQNKLNVSVFKRFPLDYQISIDFKKDKDRASKKLLLRIFRK